MRGGIPLAGLTALAIAVAGGVLLRDLSQQPPPRAPAAREGAASAGTPARAGDSASGVSPALPDPDVAAEVTAGSAPRPASLRGTNVDGGLVTGADGRFVATPDARRLFDYFLAASGEEPEATLVARVRAEIARRLPPEAAGDAALLFDRYLVYRARARTLAEQGLAEAELDERLATLRELRRETLGAEAADALFAEEEEVDQVAIAKLRATEGEELGADERRRRLAAAEAELPALERERRRAALAAIDLRAAEAALLAEGGSAAEVRALREEKVGSEAAERLAALDASRAAWQQRVADYRAARLAIASDPALDAPARARAIERLRTERFSESERLRVAALDEIEPR